MRDYPFQRGQQYSRKDVFRILEIPAPTGGNWFTGYNAYGDDWFIFCGIGTPGRTGHDYRNHFDGDELVWFGKNNAKRGQPAIEALLNPKGQIYIFYREDNKAPFTFAGVGRPKAIKNTVPVQVRWAFNPKASEHGDILPDEIAEPDRVIEGAKKQITVNAFERDASARLKCIAKWGSVCTVCDFDFGEVYGSLGAGYIHVHHLKPLSEIGESYTLDPINDLRPVCPNCHAMLHRSSPAMTPEELKKALRKRR